MKYFIPYLVLIFIFSCSKRESYSKKKIDDIVYHNNKNIPHNKNFTIKIKKIFTLDSSNQYVLGNISNVYFSEEKKNIYLFDNDDKSIKVFNNKGIFIQKIGREGAGPGEFRNQGSLIMLDDTLNVFTEGKIHKFNSSGHFCYSNSLDFQTIFFNISNFQNFIVYEKLLYKQKEGTWFRGVNLELSENNLSNNKIIKESLWDIKEDYKNPYSFFKNSIPFTIINNRIFVATHNKAKYQIEIFKVDSNKKIKKVEIINKSYKKTEIKNNNLKIIKNSERNMLKNYVSGSELKKAYKNSIKFYDYRVPILSLLHDYKNRLWVNRGIKNLNQNSYFIFDIFKNGVFLNNIKLKLNVGLTNTMYHKYHDIYIFKNYIYAINRNKSLLSVYKICN